MTNVIQLLRLIGLFIIHPIRTWRQLEELRDT